MHCLFFSSSFDLSSFIPSSFIPDYIMLHEAPQSLCVCGNRESLWALLKVGQSRTRNIISDQAVFPGLYCGIPMGFGCLKSYTMCSKWMSFLVLHIDIYHQILLYYDLYGRLSSRTRIFGPRNHH